MVLLALPPVEAIPCHLECPQEPRNGTCMLCPLPLTPDRGSGTVITGGGSHRECVQRARKQAARGKKKGRRS